MCNDKVYVIKVLNKIKRKYGYFVTMGTKPLVVCCPEIEEAKVCDSATADEWIIALEAINIHRGLDKDVELTKILIKGK